MLSPKEHSLLTNISQVTGPVSQRELAQKTGVSIGLANLVLRRLIHKGYVRVKALNKKKIAYLLTPKGASQHMKRSYEGVIQTIKRYQQIEKKVSYLVHDLIEKRHTTFYLQGEGELSKIVRRCLRRYNDSIVILEAENEDNNLVILNLTKNRLKTNGKQVVDVLEYLK